MPTLSTRIISGRGLLRVPESPELRKAKRLSLFVDVIRPPKNGYLNNTYNPPKSRYGTINVFKQGYQMQEIWLEYPYQVFHFYPSPSDQVFYLAKCSYELLLAQLIEMSDKLGLLTDNSPNPFTDWWHSNYWFDELKIVCYADTALRLVLESEDFLLCPNDDDPQPTPQPPPPPESEQLPPSTPLSEANTPVSDPYQAPDDEGDTVPYEGDQFEPPPSYGTECTNYFVLVEWEDQNGTTQQEVRPFRGIIRGVRSTNTSSPRTIEIEAQSPAGLSQPCTALAWRLFTSASSPQEYNDPRIISVDPA